MDRETPVACSLSGSGLRDRYRDLQRFGSANLIDRSSGEAGQRLRFRRTAESEQQVRSIIAAEQECCPFLSFELTATEHELEVLIATSEDARPVAEELAAAFS